MLTSAFGQSGINAEMIKSFLTGTGLITLLGVAIFLIIRHKVIRLVVVDQNTEWVRAKWGMASTYRFGKKRGRLVRLQAGRHLFIRAIYDGWEVSHKEVVMDLENVEQPFMGRALKYYLITIGYQVIAPDTPKGDEMVLRSILSVRDSNRENGTSQNLDQKVKGIALEALGRLLKATEPDRYGLPLVSEEDVILTAAKELKKKHGLRLSSFKMASPVWVQGQQQYDAGKLIAQAMGLDETTGASQLSGPATVVELPVQTSV